MCSEPQLCARHCLLDDGDIVGGKADKDFFFKSLYSAREYGVEMGNKQNYFR